jgi:hypothetical protein
MNPIELMQQMIAAQRAVESRQTLLKNSQMNFVQRAMQGKNQPSIQQPNGMRATHKMAWAEADGRFWVYPTVVMTHNGLIELSPDAAWKLAIQRREAIPFDTAEEAQAFSSTGYKTGSGMQRAY